MDNDKELFKKALGFVLKMEGGFVNDPNDRGGATNKGITQTTYNSYLRKKGRPTKDVRNITDAEVEDIYYNSYWLTAGCDKMLPIFAVYCFDTAVNMGVGRVKPLLQACKYTDPDVFIIERIRKYKEFAKNQTQRKFLFGWLNRVFALIDFAKTL